MRELIEYAKELLHEDGFLCQQGKLETSDFLTLENPTVLGFIIFYEATDKLINDWRRVFNLLVTRHMFALRRADKKAWNTYLVLLSSGSQSPQERVALMNIEEDLSEARKLAKAGLASRECVRSALLPLLKLQSAPNLGAIDFEHELRIRLSDLPEHILNAFISNAPISRLYQSLVVKE